MEKVGNFWIGPDNTMPQGFIMEFDKLISVDSIELRNGESKGWASGTQDFEILLGNTANGPWKRILSDTLAIADSANPPQLVTFRSERNNVQ